jgi:hypothetical protein
MAKAVVITYECNRCGTEIVVSPAEGAQLSPIYCCGIGVTEISSVEKKAAKAKKAVKKVAKKVSKKKVTQKKKPALKKKTVKK